MGYNQYWQIDELDILKSHAITAKPAAIKNDDILKFFEFTVERHKDTGSQQEQIKISASVQGQPSGTVTTNLIDIEKDILNLRKYGVALKRQYYVELCHLISDHYHYFSPIATKTLSNVVTDPVAEDIFNFFCGHIKRVAIKPIKVKMEEVYNVSLKDFNAELVDSEFSAYNLTEVKEALFNKGYTVANKGKFDYVVSVDGTKIKMVSFKKDAVDSRLKKLDEDL